MCESRGKETLWMKVESREKDRKKRETVSSCWGGVLIHLLDVPHLQSLHARRRSGQCPAGCLPDLGVQPANSTQYECRCRRTEDTAAISPALYLLAEKFLHGFSELCRTDLAVTVGVELWVVERKEPVKPENFKHFVYSCVHSDGASTFSWFVFLPLFFSTFC